MPSTAPPPGFEARSGRTTAGDHGTVAPYSALYDRAVTRLLDVPVTDAWVRTGASETHVLLAGDAANPPVVVFQGGNVTTPITLSWVQHLADEYYLIAPDTPGEPGKIASAVPADYGRWALALLDGLMLERTAIIGLSHGAGILLELAAHAPERISAAALVVPAGFGVSLSLSLARVVVPSLVYRLLPDRRLLATALQPLFTQPVADVEPVILDTVSTALRTSDLGAAFPGPDDPVALAAFDAPTLLVAAECDPFFPAAWTHERALALLSPTVERVTLDSERHFLSPGGQQAVTDRLRSFLATRADTAPARP